jgi:hypothetical protein
MTDDFAQEAPRASEPLHPDLVPYLEELDDFGQILRHPLVFEIPFDPDQARRVNHTYLARAETVRQAEADRHWFKFMLLHQRPYRVDAFRSIRRRLTNPEYWELLGEMWTDYEGLMELGEATVRSLLGSKRAGRENLMEEEERQALAALPDRITIYRGYQSPGGTPEGWSWTLAEGTAEWFARRLIESHQTPMVARGAVAKADVIAHFLGRNETEIVVDPLRVERAQALPISR